MFTATITLTQADPSHPMPIAAKINPSPMLQITAKAFHHLRNKKSPQRDFCLFAASLDMTPSLIPICMSRSTKQPDCELINRQFPSLTPKQSDACQDARASPRSRPSSLVAPDLKPSRPSLPTISNSL